MAKKQITLPKLKRKAQTVFNTWIRKRDKDLPCISCKKARVSHAGHYIAQGSSSLLRFNEKNVNGQCVGCNTFKHGNLLEYRMGLVERYGLNVVKELESKRHEIKKWKRWELEEIIEKYS